MWYPYTFILMVDKPPPPGRPAEVQEIKVPQLNGRIGKLSIDAQHHLAHRMPGLDLAMGFNALFKL